MKRSRADGEVEVMPEGTSAVPPPEVVALLRELAAGHAVAPAARRIGVTPSSARRSLGALRLHWDRRNNVALVVEAVRRGLV
jgi:hypothetical protein